MIEIKMILKFKCKIINIFWRFGVFILYIILKFDKIIIGGCMKDPRISIRLSEEEHTKFKTLAIKKKKSMQDLLVGYVRREIKKEEVKSNEKAN